MLYVAAVDALNEVAAVAVVEGCAAVVVAASFSFAVDPV